MSGRAFTHAEIASMSQEQLAEIIDEVNAWVAAGAVDGQAPAEPKRPEGHHFTRTEIAAMSPEEVVANNDAIAAQLAAGGIV